MQKVQLQRLKVVLRKLDKKWNYLKLYDKIFRKPCHIFRKIKIIFVRLQLPGIQTRQEITSVLFPSVNISLGRAYQALNKNRSRFLPNFWAFPCNIVSWNYNHTFFEHRLCVHVCSKYAYWSVYRVAKGIRRINGNCVQFSHACISIHIHKNVS